MWSTLHKWKTNSWIGLPYIPGKVNAWDKISIYIYIYVVPYRTRAFPRATLPAEQNSCERITQLLNQYVWEATGASASSTLLHPHFCNLECVFSLECWVWVQQKPSHIQHGRLQLWYGRLLFWAWNHHATPWRACLLSQVRWQLIRWKIDHWFSLWVIHFHFSTIFMFLCILLFLGVQREHCF